MNLKLPSPAEVYPNVRATADNQVFEVKSSSRARWHRVDGQARGGLMQCACEADRTKTYSRVQGCKHVRAVREFVALIAMQGCILKNQPK